MNIAFDRPVLVTGATGFTGRHLVRALASTGQQIRVVVRSSVKAAGLPYGVDVREADITDPHAVSPVVEGVGTIYHLAAAYREAAHREKGYWQINVGATRNLLEAAAANDVGRFVHCSTVGVHGHISNPPADEATDFSPGDAYQRTKLEGELLALSYARHRGLAVTVARPTAIYGPGDTRLLKMFRMIANGTFVMLGRRDIYYHMVYVDDLVEGLMLLGTHPRAVGEVFILGGEKYFRLEAIAGMIADLLGVGRPRLRLPARPFQMLGSLCEAICVRLGVEPPIYRRRVDFFTKSRAFSIEKARRILGYSPQVPLEEGLRRTLAWYRSNGQITPARGLAPSAEADWAVALFNRSVLKQAKFRRIAALLDEPAGRTNLDIGADNGVISYLLRRRGGRWYSADLDERAVESIRQLVGENVYRLESTRMPFPDQVFDQVVVVDYLEHILDDGAFARDLERILKPGGRVIINVPHIKPGSLLGRLRHAVGLTDEWHGHVRPGYTVEGLRALLGPGFQIERAVTYSRAFSELVDTGLNGLYLKMQKPNGPASRKGTVVTQSDLRKHRKQFLVLSALYPLLWTVAQLDSLLWFQPGYKLIVSARRQPPAVP